MAWQSSSTSGSDMVPATAKLAGLDQADSRDFVNQFQQIPACWELIDAALCVGVGAAYPTPLIGRNEDRIERGA